MKTTYKAYKAAKTHELWTAFGIVCKEISRLWSVREDASGLLVVLLEIEREIETRPQFTVGRLPRAWQTLSGLT